MRGEPPEPGTLEGLALLARVAHDPLRSITRAARTYGDIASFRLGTGRFFLLSHPELIEQVLVADGRRHAKGRGLQRARRILGDGLLTSEGETHRRHRRVVQPHFHHQRIAGYAAVMAEEAERMTAEWGPGATVEVTREMSRLTMRVIARTLFSTDVDEEVDEVSSAVGTLIELFDRTLLPTAAITNRLPLPSTRRMARAEREVDALVARLLRERRGRADGDGDLLASLLDARDASGRRVMSDGQVRDEVATLFLAGHETTATWLSWAWVLLALQPAVEARLHAELDTVLDGRPATAADYERLRVTRQVLSETMRLFPTVWMISRRAIEDTRVAGHVIPAGSIVMMSPWVVHRDPRWWPDPRRVDLDRWSGDGRDVRPRFAYFPFGGGTRKCLGESFAWLEATLVLASVARRWRLRLADDRRVVPLPRITLRPKGGVRVVLEARG